MAHALLVLCAPAHGQPRPAGERSCGDAVALLNAAGQHRHLQTPVQSACDVMTTLQETQNMLALVVTDAHSLALLSLGEIAHGTCSGSNQSTDRLPVNEEMCTSASQLAARKKGVEKRSLLLTTLCSVDLKRPLVHLQRQTPLTIGPAGLSLST